MASPSAPHPLSWKLTEQIVADWNWTKLKQQFDACRWNEDNAKKLVTHIRRYAGIVSPHSSESARGKKQKFLESLRDLLHSSAHKILAQELTSLIAEIKMIETGYSRILDALEDMKRENHADESILCELMQETVRGGEKMLLAMNAKNAEVGEFRATTRYTALDGQTVEVDRANSINMIIATMTAKMFGIANGWFGPDGLLTLPKTYRQRTGCPNHVRKIGALGLAWHNLEHTEKRLRFLGGRLKFYGSINLPENAPSDFRTAIEYLPANDEIELYDKIANLRLKEKANQNLLEMLTQVRHNFGGCNKTTKLAPAEFLSNEEMHGYFHLTESLAFDISEDPKKYGGLRLIEWLRGYATLQQFVHDKFKRNRPRSVLIELPQEDYIRLLVSVGLCEKSAKAFIAAMCFTKHSDDFFDNPLIRVEGGNLLLFGQALRNANLPAVLLSMLNKRQIQIRRKGTAFETEVRKLLENQDGIELGSYKGKQKASDGSQEEFELDVVAIWEGKIFLFECKNESLSDGSPSAIAYFESGMRSNVTQTLRLVRGITSYPDILNTAFNGRFTECELRAMPIIPCVIYNKSYARSVP